MLHAALVAGYLGTIDDILKDGKPDFVQSATTDANPVLVVQLVGFAITIARSGSPSSSGSSACSFLVLQIEPRDYQQAAVDA